MCPRCGYALPGTGAGSPSLGAPVFSRAGTAAPVPLIAPPGPESLGPPVARKGSNGLCVASMVLGIIGIIPLVGFVLGLLALILGVVGVSQANKRGEPGKGMGITGIVLGSISVAFHLIVGIAFGTFVLATYPSSFGVLGLWVGWI